jgi:hypothetical protein
LKTILRRLSAIAAVGYVLCLSIAASGPSAEIIHQKELGAGRVFRLTKEVLPPGDLTEAELVKLREKSDGAGFLDKPDSIIVYRAVLQEKEGTRELWSKRVRHYSSGALPEFVLLDAFAADSEIVLCYKAWDQTSVHQLSSVEIKAGRQPSTPLLRDNTIRPDPVFVNSAHFLRESNGAISVAVDLSPGRQAKWVKQGDIWQEVPSERSISPVVAVVSPVAVDVSVIRAPAAGTKDTNGTARGRVWPRSGRVIVNGVAAQVDSNGVWIAESVPLEPGKLPLIRIEASLR